MVCIVADKTKLAHVMAVGRHTYIQSIMCEVTATRLRMQEVAAHAGQVIDVPMSDQVSMASGDQTRSSKKRGSSSNDCAERPTLNDGDEGSLLWKLQVLDIQVAMLSLTHLGTAQLVADECSISQVKHAYTTEVEVRSTGPWLLTIWRTKVI
jgi:hypothetical protein